MDAMSDMRAVLAEQPTLHPYGFGVYESKGKTLEQISEEIKLSRETMLGERCLNDFVKSREWLRQFSKTKAMNHTGTSYGLKHVAEREMGYTSNGVFIAAALAEGFRIKIRGPNAFFNISQAAWKAP